MLRLEFGLGLNNFFLENAQTICAFSGKKSYFQEFFSSQLRSFGRGSSLRARRLLI